MASPLLPSSCIHYLQATFPLLAFPMKSGKPITTMLHNNLTQTQMTLLKPFKKIIQSMDSSHSIQMQQQRQQQQQVSVESIETRIGDLFKRWKRRQRWHLLFSLGENVEGKGRWRTRLINFMESTPIHIISLSLLFIDLVLVALELFSTMLSCSSYKVSYPLDPNCSKGHLTKIAHVNLLVWFHALGIGILSLLSLKSVALMLGLGFGFFKRPGCVVDSVVVGVALLLEAFMERGGGGGLVVVVSLWRLVRVVESTFELSDEAIEAQIEKIVCQFEALKEENEKLVKIILEKDDMIEKLQQELSQM